ncbi:MAG: ArnT family glycosyltransferase [Thermoleophilia bacterium]
MRRSIRQDLIVSAALFAATLAVRIPYFGHTLYNWDSVNYALSLERFSVADHQPHAPGYILYVAAGRIAQALFGNPNSALIFLSILGSAAAVAGIYLAGRSVFNRATGIVAAVILLFSPLGWFYADIASPYSFMLPIMIACIWLVYQLLFYKRYPLASAIVMGVAAGFRPDVLLFLGPFWLYGTFLVGRRRMLLAWAAMAVSVVAWLVPLIALSGGISGFRQVIDNQYSSGVRPSSVFSSGFAAAKTNARRVLQALFWMFGPAGAGLLYALLFWIPKRLRPERKSSLLMLLLLVPASVFFIFFLFDPLGYLLLYVPPLLLLTARGFTVASECIKDRLEKRALVTGPKHGGEPTYETNGGGHSTKPVWVSLAIVLAVISLANSYLYLNGADITWRLPTTGPLSVVFGAYSAGGIRDADGELYAAVDAVKRFDPVSTVIVTTTEPFTPYIADWRRLMYYLPEYDTIMLRRQAGAGFLVGFEHQYEDSGMPFVPLPHDSQQVLLLQRHAPQNIYPSDMTRVDVPGSGLFITLLDIPSDGRVQFDQVTLIRQ